MAVFRGLVVGSFVLPLSFSGTAANAEASSEKVQQKAGETVEASKEYASEKRAEFESSVRKQLKNVDAELERLKKKAQHSSETARAGFNDQILKLEEKQEELSERLKALSKSSGKAWDRLKVGVEAAWSDLKTAVDEAGQKLKE